MPTPLVIFDLDGVLFDSIGFARDHFLARHPGVTAAMYDEIHTGNYHEGARRYAHLKMPLEESEEHESRARYAERKRNEVAMFAGMKELLHALRAEGCLLALNTNGFEKNCYPLLERAGVKDIFDLIACAETSMDKVEKFGIIEAGLGITAQHSVFVTDALGDVRDAERAGIPTIAVTFGVHGRDYFTREPHPLLLGIADSPDALGTMLRAWIKTVRT